MAIPSRALGRSGLSVSALGFGAAPLGDLYKKLDEQVALRTVTEAVRSGITLLDVSPHYGNDWPSTGTGPRCEWPVATG